YEMYRLWKRVKGLHQPWLMYRKKSKYKATEKKAVEAAACSKYTNVLNGAGACVFGAQIGVDRVPLFEWLNAATGWNKTPNQYMDIGARLQTMKQAFNIKHGIDPKSYRPNPRALGEPPMSEGANRNRQVDVDRMVVQYWQQFKWDDQTGKPPGEMVEHG
ncbi:MAG: aldehyde ferredoxin oxidoreductase C-terminal domain-containing protein, partial [Desulfobacterales bacterium]|nr:aldehyde ferredoxin oxidoreductase C-terminal domain-containing protein [Desulfobacterales bacterium]